MIVAFLGAACATATDDLGTARVKRYRIALPDGQ
jgi:hypothetical protein